MASREFVEEAEVQDRLTVAVSALNVVLCKAERSTARRKSKRRDKHTHEGIMGEQYLAQDRWRSGRLFRAWSS